MNAAIEAGNALKLALKGITGTRFYPDAGPAVSPPAGGAVVLGPPVLRWEALCVEPTSARWVVWAVVAADVDRTLDRLLELVPKVAAALDAVRDAVVVQATPGRYPSSNGDLPAYEVSVEYALN